MALGTQLVVAPLIAFAVAAVLTPLAGRLGLALGVVDRPSGRGVGGGGVPLLGGVALLVAVVVALALVLDVGPIWTQRTTAILLGAVAIAAVGLADDRFDLHWSVKLAGQVGAALIPVTQGVVVENVTIPFLGAIRFEALSVPLTVIGMVGVMNVVNLSDGVDGLAGGVCAIAAVAFAVIAWDLGRFHAAILAAATAGAALGFLVHNFPPASIYMGDTGANLLGYLLACVAVEGSVKTQVVLALVAPLLVLAVPVLDTTFVVLKRIKSRVPIYTADQNHFHHRFARIGFSQRRTVIWLYGWALMLGAFAVALRFVPYNSETHPGDYDPLWTTAMALIALVVVGVSVYVVTVLEILKLRRLDAIRLRRSRPHATEAEIDADVARIIETGEMDAITGELTGGGDPRGPRR